MQFSLNSAENALFQSKTIKKRLGPEVGSPRRFSLGNIFCWQLRAASMRLTASQNPFALFSSSISALVIICAQLEQGVSWE